ncbi:MAG: phosphate regulon transcriptional regulatory protein PhoB [Gammaproteobacteria bacterium SG8_11]|nr:MAG: phosphate regulon transcriptional regulatory protein PhoB [Gammaproteobacteria bacterium SG8_11]
MVNQHILIVEDETAISDMIGFTVERAGYSWSAASDSKQAVTQIGERLPDLILLDWMLPGISGIDFAKRLRKDEVAHEVPIIMLTARGEESDKLRGFDAGVDDYVSKPFSPKELVARIKAVLRRVSPFKEDSIYQIEDLKLDASSHRVSVNDRSVEMGPTEFKLLQFLMTHPERVYSRTQLLDYVWGSNVYIEDRTVDVHIRRLRKALGDHGYDRFIQTVRGAGYRFSPQG